MNDCDKNTVLEFLEPACRNKNAISLSFESHGFKAAVPLHEFWQVYAGTTSQREKARFFASKVISDDLVRPYRNKVPIPGQSQNSEEFSALRGTMVSDFPLLWDDAMIASWRQFCSEANALDSPWQQQQYGTRTRDKALRSITKRILMKYFPDAEQVSVAHLHGWHPHDKWVDAAYRLASSNNCDFIISFETPRPRPERLAFSDFEPKLPSTVFDQTEVILWVLPGDKEQDRIDSFFQILYGSLVHMGSAYWRFNSYRGMARIADAHLALIKLMFDACLKG